MRRKRGNCCCAFSLCRDNMFASIFYSIFWFSENSLKRITCENRWPFFEMEISLSHWTCRQKLHFCMSSLQRLFLGILLLVWGSSYNLHCSCTFGPPLWPLWSQQLDQIMHGKCISLTSRSKNHSRVKTRILKISWVLSLLLWSKTCYLSLIHIWRCRRRG